MYKVINLSNLPVALSPPAYAKKKKKLFVELYPEYVSLNFRGFKVFSEAAAACRDDDGGDDDDNKDLLYNSLTGVSFWGMLQTEYACECTVSQYLYQINQK